jgi:hypothetical protein
VSPSARASTAPTISQRTFVGWSSIVASGWKLAAKRRVRGQADGDRGECEQVVGLDDCRVTVAHLNAPALAWELAAMGITKYHAASS